MGHGIEVDAEGARFAYSSSSRQMPWHRLGHSVRGLGTVEEMLAAARADFDVVTTGVAAVDADGNFILNPDGKPVTIGDSRATVRVNPDGTFTGLSTVGTRYVVQQNREVLERAVAIAGASTHIRDGAVIDTCGVLDGGKEFFAAIDLGSIYLDPSGANDEIRHYMVVRNGHDGKTPITYANTPIRVVCKNTVLAAVVGSKHRVSARHTKNADMVVDDSAHIITQHLGFSVGMQVTAQRLMRVSVELGSRAFDRALEAAFPSADAKTVAQKRNRDESVDKVKELLGSSLNAQRVGWNAWAAYNAIAEYFDHARVADSGDRATASMSATSWVTKRKESVLATLIGAS